MDSAHTGRHRRDSSKRPRASVSTRVVVILLVSVGGAVLAATSAAWATGLAIGVALLTVLSEFIRDGGSSDDP